MLRNTFIHLPGFTRKLELDFWSSGIENWSDSTLGSAAKFN